MIQAARIIGIGLATTGLIGAGVGIGVVFGALILGVVKNAYFFAAFLSTITAGVLALGLSKSAKIKTSRLNTTLQASVC